MIHLGMILSLHRFIACKCTLFFCEFVNFTYFKCNNFRNFIEILRGKEAFSENLFYRFYKLKYLILYEA